MNLSPPAHPRHHAQHGAAVNTGARTRVALALMGRDRDWLAERSRLGANTIDRLLNDSRREPGGRTLERVARVLGVSRSWLTADVAQRELSPVEQEELLRCVSALRRLARGARVDARAEPNARPARGHRMPPSLRGLGGRHVYRVRGRSLSGFGLLDGDLVSVQPLPRGSRLHAAVGALVLFRLNGALYLKQLTVPERDVVVLRSAFAGYDPIVIAGDDDFALLGRAVASMRELGPSVARVSE
jgi:SOS-response transcriptional repressor LexA